MASDLARDVFSTESAQRLDGRERKDGPAGLMPSGAQMAVIPLAADPDSRGSCFRPSDVTASLMRREASLCAAKRWSSEGEAWSMLESALWRACEGRQRPDLPSVWQMIAR